VPEEEDGVGVLGRVINVLDVSCEVVAGAAVVGGSVLGGDSTIAEAAAKSKMVGCTLVSIDNVGNKSPTVGVAETIAMAQDANASLPAFRTTLSK
jgi:hypothetical protein